VWHSLVLGHQLFALLVEVDENITRQVAAAGCPECGGPLYRSDYDRKPRGGLIVPDTDAFRRRFSLCCGREGCRQRAMPPSVRFLGRKVYVGAVVLLASALALLVHAAAELRRRTGIPTRTVRRWGGWWRTEIPVTALFLALSGHIVPPLDAATLPLSLLDRLMGTAAERLVSALGLLAPLTTCSVRDGARFLRGLLSPAGFAQKMSFCEEQRSE
jgi:hypothetical protein